MEPISVMLVDDNATFLHATRQFLEAHKEVIVVGAANGGAEAVEQVQRLNPQVILIDLAMPGMPGLEAIPRLRHLLPGVGIIALTVMDTDSFRQAALNAGADVFISKASMRTSLLPAIQRALKAQRGREAQGLVASGDADAAMPQRILLMEDDPSQRRLYIKVLHSAGYEVDEAGTMQEARELLRQHHFAVFLCDIHMGQERGTDLLREQGDALRENGTQIIVVSADSQYRSIAEDMGIEFYLEKPISIASLARLMDRLTRRQ